MSYLQFPSETYLKIVDASGEMLGTFTVTDNTDLLYVVVNMYIKGTVVGSERMRLNLYASEAMNDPVATSDWLYWEDITDIGAGNYLGWLRFDFSGYPVSNAYPYYVKIETTNYTRNADTYYLAAVCEYGVRLSTIAKRPGVHLAIVGKR